MAEMAEKPEEVEKSGMFQIVWGAKGAGALHTLLGSARGLREGAHPHI